MVWVPDPLPAQEILPISSDLAKDLHAWRIVIGSMRKGDDDFSW